MVDMTSLENAEFKEAFDEFDKVTASGIVSKKPHNFDI